MKPSIKKQILLHTHVYIINKRELSDTLLPSTIYNNKVTLLENEFDDNMIHAINERDWKHSFYRKEINIWL